VNDEQRAAYRAFVKAHHPDRGGDPEAFVAGLAEFEKVAAQRPAAPPAAPPPAPAPPAPAAPLPVGVRVAIALIRTVRAHRARGDNR
jgi:hypothetical protein